MVSVSLASCTGAPSNSNAPQTLKATTPNANQPASAAATGYEGFQDDINCFNLVGWAWDAQRPNEPLKIEIYDGNTLLVTVTADLFRQDLLDARKGNGAHAFNYAIPARLRDGKPHTIRTKIAGTDVDLVYTLKQLTCKAE
mgnify:CR=1 FL=1